MEIELELCAYALVIVACASTLWVEVSRFNLEDDKRKVEARAPRPDPARARMPMPRRQSGSQEHLSATTAQRGVQPAHALPGQSAMDANRTANVHVRAPVQSRSVKQPQAHEWNELRRWTMSPSFRIGRLRLRDGTAARWAALLSQPANP